MNRPIMAALLLMAAGTSIACNRGKDLVEADGTKRFGKRTLKDGTLLTQRIESPDGEKDFEVSEFPDGTLKFGRIELANGEKEFDRTEFPDDTVKIARTEFPDGEKRFDEITFPNKNSKIARIEFPDGRKYFDVEMLPDGTYENIGRAIKADGSEWTVFAYAQNDEQGYADVKWGTAAVQVDADATGQGAACFLSDRQENEAVASAFGVPYRNTVVAGAVLSTYLDFSLVPSKCKTVTKGDVTLIFYEDKLAMAFSHLNAHNYDAIASELASKFPERDGWSTNWGGAEQ